MNKPETIGFICFLAGILFLIGMYALDSNTMEECQQKYSYDTCFYQLNH